MKNNRLGVGVHKNDLFKRIIAPANLFAAWREFRLGKMRKIDLLRFAEHAEYELVKLHADLSEGRYAHGGYKRFCVLDPKKRSIAKASVRDRVLHHAICRILVPIIDKSFIHDSYASRKNKGTLAANKQLNLFANRISQNGTRMVWILKCDIRKFFDSVDHDILLQFCARYVGKSETYRLIENIVRSFETHPGKGVPLGNLTSQLFANIYMNALDQFVKRTLGVTYYIRYTDDFVLMSHDRKELEVIVPKISHFLSKKLSLELHPQKISFCKWHLGVDFLGYVHFPNHNILRTKTKQRMLRKLKSGMKRVDLDGEAIEYFEQVKQSYIGILSHAHARDLSRHIKRTFKVKTTLAAGVNNT